jgi:uncharacterized protein (DUF1778 family)
MTNTKDDTLSKTGKETLQLRLNASDIKQIKLAAIQLDFPTISDFMVTCFREYMKSKNLKER